MAIADTILNSVLPPGYRASAPSIAFESDGESQDCFAVHELASQSVAAASAALAAYANQAQVTVDQRLAYFWFGKSFRPVGWTIPKLRDEFSADYEASDGWVRLHCNAPAHRAAMLTVLDQPSTHEEAARRVQSWAALDLQEAVVAAGGASAKMYSAEEWASHPQGQQVAAEPFVHWSVVGQNQRGHEVDPERPLAGIKVLDLTRIIAGPVATRFLAGFGASVLRIDPPGWDEIGNIPEMTPGKRCATLDFKTTDDKQTLAKLIAEADVLVHGYRADALERLGLGESQRQQLNPGLIDVALNAFGWTGPWRNRRGFDSLVQMSSGIAMAGRIAAGIQKPRPLTVQALDHATGYCLAASVLNALTHQRLTGEICSARLSLARTAELLKTTAQTGFGEGFSEETENDRLAAIEETNWGPAQRLRFPMSIGSITAAWDSPATPLHTARPEFTL